MNVLVVAGRLLRSQAWKHFHSGEPVAGSIRRDALERKSLEPVAFPVIDVQCDQDCAGAGKNGGVKFVGVRIKRATHSFPSLR
ncbi:MAG: hypothetical protein WB420_03885 [Bradyrhizobium sp.]